MEKQQGRTATVTKKKGEVSVGKARAKNRPLTIAYPDPPYPLEGAGRSESFSGAPSTSCCVTSRISRLSALLFRSTSKTPKRG